MYEVELELGFDVVELDLLVFELGVVVLEVDLLVLELVFTVLDVMDELDTEAVVLVNVEVEDTIVG